VIILVLTRSGYDVLGRIHGCAVLWVSAGVLGKDEVEGLRASGRNVTTFANEIRSHEEVQEALTTIREHHPTESIWREAGKHDR